LHHLLHFAHLPGGPHAENECPHRQQEADAGQHVRQREWCSAVGKGARLPLGCVGTWRLTDDKVFGWDEELLAMTAAGADDHPEALGDFIGKREYAMVVQCPLCQQVATGTKDLNAAQPGRIAGFKPAFYLHPAIRQYAVVRLEPVG
jgi:hypothetical protein